MAMNALPRKLTLLTGVTRGEKKKARETTRGSRRRADQAKHVKTGCERVVAAAAHSLDILRVLGTAESIQTPGGRLGILWISKIS